MLAIVWVNDDATNNADSFNDHYDVADRDVARAIVRRAVDDWNKVITNFNYQGGGNTFNLTVVAEERENALSRGGIDTSDSSFNSGVPTAGKIRLDDNGGGKGWFFDETPWDDIEFTGIGNAFAATFLDVDAESQANQREDFYRTVVHEIGHALGLLDDVVDTRFAIADMYDVLYTDSSLSTSAVLRDPSEITFESGTSGPFATLIRFDSTRSTPQFGVTATFLRGAHLYEGDIYSANNDPTVVYFQGPNGVESETFVTHPNDLYNRREASPAGNLDPNDPTQRETSRQFISDLDVKILADAYGYSVVLPSTLNTAHAMLDVWTGTLLVQGGARDNSTGTGVNDTIELEKVTSGQTDYIEVTVSYNSKTFTERVPFDQVTNIIIHGNGGTDSITVNSNVSATKPWQEVQYVVSSNEDAIETSTSVGGDSTTNGIVDLSPIIPGSQTTLRAAVRVHGKIRFDSPCSMFRIAA